MKGEGMDKVREALPELPASQAFSLTRSIYTADDMHAYARAALASQAEKHAAELAKLRQGEARAVRDAAISWPAPSVPAVPEGCACRWDADDKRVQTCERHQVWLDVIAEWADRTRAAEAAIAAARHPAAKGAES